VTAAVLNFLMANATLVQALLFGAVMALCWGAEAKILDTDLGRKRQRVRVNALFAASVLPIQVAMAMLYMALAYEVTARHWGLLYLMPNPGNPWLKYGAMFFALDFLDYVYHRVMHHVPALWRLHLVHHTDQAIDVSTTMREHPGETVARNAFLIVWVAACGASPEVLVLRQTAQTVANILAHTSFRLPKQPARVLGWLLVTPNLHHVHHHRFRPYTDSNYGDVFSIWDRLFGTFANLAAEDTDFGLDTHASPLGDDGYRRAMAMPFDR
jgi:sterol desaturase/sphingolipid hydroxylase (fatty acid hydroxylase superfamily)